jgi:hypothetical protein
LLIDTELTQLKNGELLNTELESSHWSV